MAGFFFRPPLRSSQPSTGPSISTSSNTGNNLKKYEKNILNLPDKQLAKLRRFFVRLKSLLCTFQKIYDIPLSTNETLIEWESVSVTDGPTYVPTSRDSYATENRHLKAAKAVGYLSWRNIELDIQVCRHRYPSSNVGMVGLSR